MGDVHDHLHGLVVEAERQVKSLPECLETLVRLVCGDGNLLLNVGPMPDGRIEPRQVERLRGDGALAGQYGESIYGTRGGPFSLGTVRRALGRRDVRDNVVYLHILDPTIGGGKLPAIERRIIAHSVLTGGTATVKQGPTRSGFRSQGRPAAD